MDCEGKLTFEEIREECEPGKTMLVDEHGTKRIYIGFWKHGMLVTSGDAGYNYSQWDENDIAEWSIYCEMACKPMEEKIAYLFGRLSDIQVELSELAERMETVDHDTTKLFNEMGSMFQPEIMKAHNSCKHYDVE